MNDSIQIWKPDSEFVLTNICPDVWIARHPLIFYGFKMIACMTVVRLPSGSLWVHSPIPLPDRGTLGKGEIADMAVLDPETIAEHQSCLHKNKR